MGCLNAYTYKIIQKAGARMLNIISEIMDISKIESGQVVIHFQETDINEMIENVYKLLKPDADNKRINLSFKNSLPAKEAFIVTDREKLYSIVTNLVKNAIKYTDKGSIEFGYYQGSVGRDKACLVSTSP